MVIGLLQFDLIIHGAESLKDKRRVVSSVKDRLHREHMASVAEVALHDRLNVARLALAVVGADGAHIGRVLDQITAKLRSLHDAELGEVSRELIEGRGVEASADYPDAEHPDPDLAAEMLRRAGEHSPGSTRGAP